MASSGDADLSTEVHSRIRFLLSGTQQGYQNVIAFLAIVYTSVVALSFKMKWLGSRPGQLWPGFLTVPQCRNVGLLIRWATARAGDLRPEPWPGQETRTQ